MLKGGALLFWIVMTVSVSVMCVVYMILGNFSTRWWGWSTERQKKFRNASWLLLAWAFVDYGHFLLSRK